MRVLSTEPTVSAISTWAVLAAAERRGVDPAMLLADHQLDPTAITSPGTRLPASTVERVWQDAIRRSREPDLVVWGAAAELPWGRTGSSTSWWPVHRPSATASEHCRATSRTSADGPGTSPSALGAHSVPDQRSTSDRLDEAQVLVSAHGVWLRQSSEVDVLTDGVIDGLTTYTHSEGLWVEQAHDRAVDGLVDRLYRYGYDQGRPTHFQDIDPETGEVRSQFWATWDCP